MTLTELFVMYKEQMMDRKKVVLCHWRDQTGFEINNVEEFETILHEFGTDEVYLLNDAENEKMFFFEYFIMSRVDPYVVVLKHPLLTNAYWADLPDKLIDSFISEESNVYRYLKICYKNNIVDYVIEFPPNIDKDIMQFCRSKMKKGFLLSNNTKSSSISVLFTNSSRFIDLDASNFVTYQLQALYPEWGIKKITPLNLSKKLWSDITN